MAIENETLSNIYIRTGTKLKFLFLIHPVLGQALLDQKEWPHKHFHGPIFMTEMFPTIGPIHNESDMLTTELLAQSQTIINMQTINKVKFRYRKQALHNYVKFLTYKAYQFK